MPVAPPAALNRALCRTQECWARYDALLSGALCLVGTLLVCVYFPKQAGVNDGNALNQSIISKFSVYIGFLC
jgi:hypothetical protein